MHICCAQAGIGRTAENIDGIIGTPWRLPVRVRLAVISAGLIVAAGAGAVGASAAPPPVPVHVWRGTDGSVCFAISQQVPHCVPGPIVGP